jgi:pimeloyl-ACP methyl ester carboxylesterase
MDLGSETPPAADKKAPDPRTAWLDVDWRRHRRWVTIGGARVNCVDMGRGPAIVLIHGLGGNWQNWLDNIPHLAARNRVIAMDLPGFGESEMPHDKISIDFYAAWIRDLLETLGVEQCVLIGNSMGGQIAAEVTLRHPELVERLVLVDAAGISAENFNKPATVEIMRRADRLFSFWSKQVVTRSRRLALRRGGRRALMSLWVQNPDDLSAQLVIELGRGTGKPGFPDALRALTQHPQRARLRQIARPTLIVWGASDRICPVRDAHEFHGAIRNSRLVILPDTGHLSMLERPDEFNALMDEFLG